jgi:hypothetical protein
MTSTQYSTAVPPLTKSPDACRGRRRDRAAWPSPSGRASWATMWRERSISSRTSVEYQSCESIPGHARSDAAPLLQAGLPFPGCRAGPGPRRAASMGCNQASADSRTSTAAGYRGAKHRAHTAFRGSGFVRILGIEHGDDSNCSRPIEPCPLALHKGLLNRFPIRGIRGECILDMDLGVRFSACRVVVDQVEKLAELPEVDAHLIDQLRHRHLL